MCFFFDFCSNSHYSTTMSVALLEVQNINKSFPGVQALSDVSFDLRAGEVHVILGENGAGKSTLMKVLTGVHRKDSGTIMLEGQEREFANPREAREHGINIIYQEFNLLPHLSVSENIFIGREFTNALGIIDEKKTYEETRSLLQRLNLEIDPHEKVAALSVGQQQMVEIAKAISCKSKVLIMDEPTAALTGKEIEKLFAVILDLKQKGVGIVYISHRLEEFDAIADRVSVLRDGKYVATRDFGQTTLRELIKLMVGRELEEKFPKRHSRIGDVLFSVKNLFQGQKLQNICFDVRAGEVLGISGIVGAGRTGLARALFGADALDSANVELGSKVLHVHSPKDAIQAGIAYLTEDRKKDGLMLDQSVEDNIMIANQSMYAHFGVCNDAISQKICTDYVESLNIKTPGIAQVAQNLSGGNQQKVVLAKWLCQRKKLFIMDEPTRGIDVGAKREVYQFINNLAEEGAAIMIISSELPEILGMSDRIMVMCKGKVAAILERGEATQEKIMYHATGGA